VSERDHFTRPPNTEPLQKERTQASSGGTYGRDVRDERTRSAGVTQSECHTESARDGADLRARRQVGGGNCRFARSRPMAAEWRRELGQHSSIREAEELERVGGVKA